MATVVLTPPTVDLVGVRAGDRNVVTFTIRSGGVPVDLTDMTVTAQAREVATDEDPALTAVVTVTDAINGAGVIRWPGPDVDALVGSALRWSGVWDLQMATSGSDPLTVCAGTFTADKDVTRP